MTYLEQAQNLLDNWPSAEKLNYAEALAAATTANALEHIAASLERIANALERANHRPRMGSAWE